MKLDQMTPADLEALRAICNRRIKTFERDGNAYDWEKIAALRELTKTEKVFAEEAKVWRARLARVDATINEKVLFIDDIDEDN